MRILLYGIDRKGINNTGPASWSHCRWLFPITSKYPSQLFRQPKPSGSLIDKLLRLGFDGKGLAHHIEVGVSVG